MTQRRICTDNWWYRLIVDYRHIWCKSLYRIHNKACIDERMLMLMLWRSISMHQCFVMIILKTINTLWYILDTWAKNSNPLLCARHHPAQITLWQKWIFCNFFLFSKVIIIWSSHRMSTDLLFHIGWSEHWLVIGRWRQVWVLGRPLKE